MLLPGFFDNARAVGFRLRHVATMVSIQLAATLFEAISIASIVPALQYMQSSRSISDLASQSTGWRLLSNVSDYLGMKLGFGVVLGIAFLGILIRQVLTFARVVYVNTTQTRLMMELRKRGLASFLHAQTDAQSAQTSGAIVNDLTNEIQSALSSMSAASAVISYALISAAYIVIVLLLSVPLSLAALAVLIIVAIGLQWITTQTRQLGRERTSANQQVASFLTERLGAARLIRLCGMEQAERDAFAKYVSTQRRTLNRLQRLQAVFGLLFEPLVLVFGFILLYIAVEGRWVSFEVLVLFFFILMRIVPIAREMLTSRQSYFANVSAVEAIRRRLRTLDKARERDAGRGRLGRLEDSIRFENVSFSYPALSGSPVIPALNNIDLMIPAGATVALVGPSGSGKSTLIDLIPRLRTPTTGRILLDGVEQSEIALGDLRRCIAYAPQRPQLFNVSVAEHIRYGKQDATDAEVREAARLAQASSFIDMLPDGYSTVIGKDGDRLSGGQRQRLDLARALVCRAPILILDEPTSNLDVEATHLFHKALLQIRAERRVTIIIIGHNLNAIQHVDRIVVLANGRISAIGCHAELLRQCEWYRSAYCQQSTSEALLAPQKQ